MTDVSFITKAQKKNNHGYNPLYSRVIRRARLILPIIAAILLTVVMFWAGHDRYGVEPVKNEELQNVVAVNQVLTPRFDSMDEQGRPFSLTAEEAKQDSENQNIISLIKPHGKITLSEFEFVEGTAMHGAYNQTEKTLQLSGGVELSYGTAYVLKTQAVAIDVEKQHAQSETSVNIIGSKLDLYATAMELDNSAGSILFRGPATVYFYQAEE